jgi:hypothetical protein
MTKNIDAQPAGFQQARVYFGERPLQRVRTEHTQRRQTSQILN